MCILFSVTCCVVIKSFYVLVSIAFLVKTHFCMLAVDLCSCMLVVFIFALLVLYLFPYFLLLFGFQIIKGIKELLMKPYQDLTMFPIILPHHDGLSLCHIMLSSRNHLSWIPFSFIPSRILYYRTLPSNSESQI